MSWNIAKKNHLIQKMDDLNRQIVGERLQNDIEWKKWIFHRP